MEKDVNSLIATVLNAKSITELVGVDEFKTNYKTLVKKIHPDRCKHAKSNEAIQHLQTLKDAFEKGVAYEDDSGKFLLKEKVAIYSGDSTLLKKSLKNYQKLKSFKDKDSVKFHRYLPKDMKFENNELIVEFEDRVVPLSGLTLELKHANWVLSRLLEINAWFGQIGMVHCGINPDTIFIVPETHGIIVTSFYHLTRDEGRLSTVSAKYKNWYTPSVFDKKVASSVIDSELAKKTVICLLGDRSGSGIKFKKTHSLEIIEFLTKQSHEYPLEVYKEWRKVLTKNFKPKFWPLHI